MKEKREYIKHGLRKSKQYRAWRNMKNRCDLSYARGYKWYGGKGISYDPKWSKFINFWEDMKDSYKDGLTLDRINGNKGYSKKNCRWIPFKEQSLNRRSNRKYKIEGKEYCISELADKYGFKYATLSTRLIKLKWPLKKALETKLLSKLEDPLTTKETR